MNVAPDISLVVPAYNSAPFILSTVERALTFFETSGLRGEVVVSDDGSTDGTSAHVPADPRVKVIRAPHNRGKGAALKRGMLRAQGKVHVFTDADLPYGTEPILRAYHYIVSHRFHAVIGDRTLPGSDYGHAGLVRGTVSAVASFAFRTLVTGGIYDTQCGFKAFRGDVSRALFPLTRVDGFAVDVEVIYLLLKYRLDVKCVPVRLERNAPSTVRVGRDSALAMRDVVAMRVRWATGRYDTRLLRDILERDLAEDSANASLSLEG